MSKLKILFESTILYRYVISAIAHPKNFVFLAKYPFWKAYNVWDQKFCGYDGSMYDWIPVGWRKAFGERMTADIVAALRKDGIPKRKWHEALQWQDIKEKYGALRLYVTTTESVDEVLAKYECLSQGYCMECGKPARYITSGWLTYLCEDCAAKRNSESTRRLTREDMPVYYRVDNAETTSLERFDIDLEALWGLEA